MATISQLTDKQAQDFANSVGDLFKSAPHLPKEWITFLVKIVPPFTIIGAVLMLLSALSAGFAGVLGLVSILVSLGSAALLFSAYKPLQEKKFEGWMYLFWANVLAAAESVVMILLTGTFFGIIGLIVGFYILFELRPSYQGKVEALKEEVKKIIS